MTKNKMHMHKKSKILTNNTFLNNRDICSLCTIQKKEVCSQKQIKINLNLPENSINNLIIQVAEEQSANCHFGLYQLRHLQYHLLAMMLAYFHLLPVL